VLPPLASTRPPNWQGFQGLYDALLFVDKSPTMMASIHDNFQHNSNELFKEGRKKADETRVTPVFSWCAAPVGIADLYVVVAVDIDFIGVVKLMVALLVVWGCHPKD